MTVNSGASAMHAADLKPKPVPQAGSRFAASFVRRKSICRPPPLPLHRTALPWSVSCPGRRCVSCRLSPVCSLESPVSSTSSLACLSPAARPSSPWPGPAFSLPPACLARLTRAVGQARTRAGA
eukprot:921262-Rhodomonas_salina.1